MSTYDYKKYSWNIVIIRSLTQLGQKHRQYLWIIFSNIRKRRKQYIDNLLLSQPSSLSNWTTLSHKSGIYRIALPFSLVKNSWRAEEHKIDSTGWCSVTSGVSKCTQYMYLKREYITIELLTTVLNCWNENERCATGHFDRLFFVKYGTICKQPTW